MFLKDFFLTEKQTKERPCSGMKKFNFQKRRPVPKSQAAFGEIHFKFFLM